MSSYGSLYTPSKWGLKFHQAKEDEVFGAGAAGPGKALSLNTLVPTPVGLRYLQDIKPGDFVFNMRGEQVEVVAESEVFEDRPCYELTICGEKIVADEHHIWCIDGGFLKSTHQIHNSIDFKQFVPAAQACDFASKDYVLDPYVFGVCLIRGQPKDRSKFTTWDPELYSTLKDVGYTLDNVSYGVAQIVQRKQIINELVSSVPEDRRILHHYMVGSFNQRMSLIEGIMDGGNGKGPLVKDKDCPFLIDFYTLCASCGLGPRIVRDFKSKKYLVEIQSPKYKCSRFVGKRMGAKKQWKLRNEIIKCRRVASVPTKCLQVKGGGTFLITKSYIVTHNSLVLLMDPLEQVRIEHMRCQQDKVPEAWDPSMRDLIQRNPLRWGQSEGWIIHLRRTLPRLSETIARAHRVFPQIDPDVDWNAKDHTFTFSSGIRYEFGHCKDRVDYNNYLSKQYSYIGFDELIEFLKEQYDFITGRKRTSDPVLRHFMKVRAMSNPRLSGNKGEDISIDDPTWVKKHFVDPWPDGNKVLRRKILRGNGKVEYVTRLYLPATLYDNPDPEYVKQYELTLLSKPKHIRDCYLYGKWDTIIGSHFGEDWNPAIHVCKPFKIPQNWPIFRSMDWGYKTHGNIGYYAVHPENILYKFFEITFQNKTASYVAKNLIKPFEEKNKLWDNIKGSKITGPADTQLWEERGESAMNKYMEFVENGVDWVRADKRSRETNAEVFGARLKDHDNFTKPPGIVFFENCKNSIKVIPAMETDHNKPEEPKKGGFDHPYDETTYACQYAKQSGLETPNYKGPIHETDDKDINEHEEHDDYRGPFGYW